MISLTESPSRGHLRSLGLVLLWAALSTTAFSAVRTPGPPEQTHDKDSDKHRALRAEQTRELEALARKYPGTYDTLYLQGRVCREQGKSLEAIEYWKRAVKVDPRRPEAYRSLGYAALQRGEYEEATKLLRKVLTMAPGKFPVRLRLAEAFVRLGEPEETLAALQRIRRGDRKALLLKGQAYLELKEFAKAAGDTREAEEAARKALEFEPGNRRYRAFLKRLTGGK